MDYTIKIGGEAGQGIQTVGDSLAKVFTRSGCHVFTHQDYESRVRGGHNFYQIRFSDRPIAASRRPVDILVALDQASIGLHERELSDGGLIIYDSSALKMKREEDHFLDVPFVALAEEHAGSRIMANTVAVGAALGMLGMKLEVLDGLIREIFGRKGEDVIRQNIAAAAAGHSFSLEHCRKCAFFSASAAGGPKMLISGIDAIALGAIASGVKFYAAYPMTPSTGIMNFLAGKAQDCGIVVEQAEDEIAAINMALGASFGGVRSMTATAGGGFALMVEGLSLAGMTETPVVIGIGQRPAPATGLPTRTEQGDLLFALHAAHGEFPRVLFAPGTPEQAFYLTNKAFELAEKYQIPAIILFDQHLADTGWSYEGAFDAGRLLFTDYRLRGTGFESQTAYRRHAFTESGVSPLAVPGEAPHVVVTDSDEHDEEGHIIEDSETRRRMVEKRLLRKLPLLRREMAPPVLYGAPEPDTVIVCWGSNFGVVKEAVDALKTKAKIAMLHFSEISPLPLPEGSGYLDLLWKAKKTVCVENNATGQFARFLRAETGCVFEHTVRKFDGRPFLIEELLGELDAVI